MRKPSRRRAAADGSGRIEIFSAATSAVPRDARVRLDAPQQLFEDLVAIRTCPNASSRHTSSIASELAPPRLSASRDAPRGRLRRERRRRSAIANCALQTVSRPRRARRPVTRVRTASTRSYSFGSTPGRSRLDELREPLRAAFRSNTGARVAGDDSPVLVRARLSPARATLRRRPAARRRRSSRRAQPCAVRQVVAVDRGRPDTRPGDPTPADASATRLGSRAAERRGGAVHHVAVTTGPGADVAETRRRAGSSTRRCSTGGLLADGVEVERSHRAFSGVVGAAGGTDSKPRWLATTAKPRAVPWGTSSTADERSRGIGTAGEIAASTGVSCVHGVHRSGRRRLRRRDVSPPPPGRLRASCSTPGSCANLPRPAVRGRSSRRSMSCW